MIALDDVVSRLAGVRQTTRGYIARCPAHEDRRASLSIRERDDARGVLLHCFAGCRYAEILRALNLALETHATVHSERPPDVHTLAVRIARAQPWADPAARSVAEVSRRVRWCYAAGDELRRLATALGDRETAWDAFALAARLEREALAAEHALDEAIR